MTEVNIQSPGWAPSASTCTPWCSTADLCEPCTSLPTPISDEEMGNWIQVASDILFFATGRQFAGSCEDTVRPVLRDVSVDYGRPIRQPWPFAGPYMSYYPAAGGMFDPTWGFWQCNRTGRSGGVIVPEITLGVYPLTSVVQVLIDGTVIDPATYTIDDNRWLVRLADPTTLANPGWPCQQRFDLAPDQKNTWEVTFTYGRPPPQGGVSACALLACQLALSANPSHQGLCRLPQRVTSITRQGVTAVVLDPMRFLDLGLTGLYEVDLWIRSVNPHGLTQRSRVINVDLSPRVRRRMAYE